MFTNKLSVFLHEISHNASVPFSEENTTSLFHGWGQSCRAGPSPRLELIEDRLHTLHLRSLRTLRRPRGRGRGHRGRGRRGCGSGREIVVLQGGVEGGGHTEEFTAADLSYSTDEKALHDHSGEYQV